MSGTIVYVHGASDRSPAIEAHAGSIRETLAARGTPMEVVAARYGDLAGPILDGILSAVPETRPRARSAPKPATSARGLDRLLQGTAAGIIALQYVNVNAPRRARVWATDRLLHRRDDLMLEILGVADVLVYQRAGDGMRAAVRDALAAVPAAGRPLIALGNSLGGIVLVDLLREAGDWHPDLLVTVGSQAAALQTFGALGPNGGDPPFQPWLNIFDRRDLVGFLAQPVWPDQPGIQDHQVDLGLGFPEVHGPAYLRSEAVWSAILAHPAVARG